MIVFDLECRGGGHRFEGWFGSSEDFAIQQASGLVVCPQCGCNDVVKAIMSPRIGRKSNQQTSAPAAAPSAPVVGGRVSPQALALFQAMAEMQGEALKDSRWVGDQFADISRAIHYGERQAETVHGQATAHEAMELLEEGIEIMPLPFPVAPPEETN